jgi:hypothetical protein
VLFASRSVAGEPSGSPALRTLWRRLSTRCFRTSVPARHLSIREACRFFRLDNHSCRHHRCGSSITLSQLSPHAVECISTCTHYGILPCSHLWSYSSPFRDFTPRRTCQSASSESPLLETRTTCRSSRLSSGIAIYCRRLKCGTNLRGVPDPQLELQLDQQTLKPARVSAGFPIPIRTFRAL